MEKLQFERQGQIAPERLLRLEADGAVLVVAQAGQLLRQRRAGGDIGLARQVPRAGRHLVKAECLSAAEVAK
jgi:hypothetical protein